MLSHRKMPHGNKTILAVGEPEKVLGPITLLSQGEGR